jgi:V/A-type H+-transporting ATPase subunit I
MLKPLPMKHVLIQAMTEDLPRISLTLARLGLFAPDDRAVDPERFPTVPGARYRELFAQASSRLDKVSRLLGQDGPPQLTGVRVIEPAELERLNNWLGELWNTGSAYEEQFRKLTDEGRLVAQLESSLDNFSNLKVDLALLQGEKTFLNLFVGILPRENLRQLEEALGLASHLLYTFLTSGETASVIIVGPRGEHQSELDAVLHAADFHPLPIPPELRSEPAKIRREIADRRTALKARRDELETQMQTWAAGVAGELADARRSLAMAEPFVRLDTSMRSVGQLAAVTGWVPAREVARLQQGLEEQLNNPFLLTVRNPEKGERPLVPTLLHSNALLAPFETLVRQYGIPRYGEIDPTPLFAVTFVLMFGMMFGDIGHGALIALAGWHYREKLGRFSQFAILAGLSATLFGFLYGSLFGYEEILHPLWIAPLTDPIYMLTVALIWGVGFIVTVSLISIHNRIVVDQRLEALFDNNGVVSLTLYLAVLAGVYCLLSCGSFGWPAAGIALAALLAIMGFKWHEVQAPPGERALVVFIETLETITGYVSNTLSFLRVAAFSLNHVALAIAVFTLAEMMQTTGHWITVVLGNLFILVLEGGIVTIQTLRLEYYEGFSRFYFGDGREFEPLRLNARTAAP